MDVMKRERRRDQRPEEEEKRAQAELPDLPQEMIAEILSRLPVKTLCRFRCVCKLWLSLLSDLQFAKRHLNQALQNENVYAQRQRFIMSSHNLYSAAHEPIGENNGGGDDLLAIELDYPLKDKPNYWVELLRRYVKDDGADNPRNWVEILGSCNGLVCISPDENALILFNPSTRESKRIPDPPFSSGSRLDCLRVHGFGFDSVNDDYKIVEIASPSVVSVYSLRADSWRRTLDFPYEYHSSFSESGTHLKNAIHWLVKGEDGNDHDCLLIAFDLAKEMFWNMPTPDVFGTCNHLFADFVVGALNGCLCVLHSCSQMHHDFWMMREYGMAGSWTTLRISISYLSMKPLWLAKNGEAVLEVDGRLTLYNLEDDTYRNLAIRVIPEDDELEADTYLESLIPPNGYSL